MKFKNILNMHVQLLFFCTCVQVMKATVELDTICSKYVTDHCADYMILGRDTTYIWGVRYWCFYLCIYLTDVVHIENSLSVTL